MDAHQRLKATALSVVVRDVPAGFWSEALTRGRLAYMDAYHQIAADTRILPEQRKDMLYQLRHFRMEHLLITLAEEYGLAKSPTVLAENGRTFAYVTTGDVGMTQAYVSEIGAMPQPARFRERFARKMDLPRLDLGDEPAEVMVGKSFYGLLAHNPVGRRFDENDQKLGMMQFCLPANDCKAWATELTITEIVQAYEAAKPADKPDRSLPWKIVPRKEEGQA